MSEQAITRRWTHYELHVLHGERWLIDSTDTDRRTLLEEAQLLLQRPGVYGVKVCKETYDPVSEVAAGRVIFQQIKPRPPQPRFRIIPQLRPELPRIEPRPEPTPRGRVAAEPRSQSWPWAPVLSLVGGTLGLLLLIGLTILG